MDPATWATLIVPALAVVAVVDSLTGLSLSISQRIGLTNRLLAHVALLFVFSCIFVIGFIRTFPLYSPLAIVDYQNPENHRFSLFFAPWLLVFQALLILCCIAAALLISLKQRRGIFLSVVAAILGNVGAIIWMIRERSARC
jgi:hypothetical protein